MTPSKAQMKRVMDGKESLTEAGACKLELTLATATWPTPRKMMTGDPTPERANDKFPNLEVVMARSAAWPTISGQDGGQTSRGNDRKDEMLMGGIVKATWPTPDLSSMEGGIQNPLSAKEQGHAMRLKDYCGPVSSGCLARTESFVVRLATLSAWLMGYTAAYLRLWEIASCRQSRRKSSKP